MAASPLRTRRGRSTRRACRAAQSMCTMARMISSLASSSGLPVSSCTSWARRPMYLVRWDFQASSRIRRPGQPSPAHQTAASRAAATAASTSRRPCWGKVASTSPVAGFTVSSIVTSKASPAPRSYAGCVPRPPYVLLSCATSADGYLDDASPRRLILSGPADLDRVDEVRAGCDAILVGAQTVRQDNPRLLIRDPRRTARRAARGLPPHPARVTLTATGDLDPAARFFAPGAPRLVYCATPALARARTRLGDSAVLIDAGDPLSPVFMLTDLAERAGPRALVEGGARVLGDFLAAGLADE